jgi:hypothetical protein
MVVVCSTVVLAVSKQREALLPSLPSTLGVSTDDFFSSRRLILGSPDVFADGSDRLKMDPKLVHFTATLKDWPLESRSTSTARKASRKSNRISRKHSHIFGIHRSPLSLGIFGWLEVLDLNGGFVFLGLLG